jgi:hypothetical protein
MLNSCIAISATQYRPATTFPRMRESLEWSIYPAMCGIFCALATAWMYSMTILLQIIKKNVQYPTQNKGLSMSDSIATYYKCAKIIKIPKQEYKIIRGNKLQNGRVRKKQMLFVKQNRFMGFVKLENGQHMDLNQPQMLVIERLVQASENGEVYVYIRDLLGYAHSAYQSLCHMFIRRKNWRQFLESTPRGYHRLRLYADEYKLKYVKAVRKVEKRKATGLLLNRKGERFH